MIENVLLGNLFLLQRLLSEHVMAADFGTVQAANQPKKGIRSKADTRISVAESSVHMI
jgi:hypothetical protein